MPHRTAAAAADTPSPVIRVAGRSIGAGRPCFLIAEAGVNHNGQPELARRLVDAAAEAGADAVKFQAFHSEQLVTAEAPKAAYQAQNTGSHESQLEMLRRLELRPEDFRALRDHAHRRGLIFLCTPFDYESAEHLAAMDLAAFKVPSGEITNLPFLRHLAAKGKPLIVSTGMATLAEVGEAVAAIRAARVSQASGEAGPEGLALLHCVSNYPAAPCEVNLRAMATMAGAFGVPVGYSDHTDGLEVPLAAAALGACVLEKHFTLDREMPGPDHRASLEPAELAALVRSVRAIEQALGTGVKAPCESELATRQVVRRSLIAARDIAAGETVTEAMLRALRPAGGISPAQMEQVVGRRAARAVRAGAMLAWGDLQ